MEKNISLNLNEIEKKLGFIFKDKDLLTLAFVHRSYWNENQSLVKGHNERLEFLGDSVLGLIVAEYLYCNLPDMSEGALSELRSRLVDASSCIQYVTKLGLTEDLLLGKGEKLNQGKGRETILSDLFEAVIGALYLDAGYEAAKRFFFQNFASDAEQILSKPAKNWKAELQDYAQKKYQRPPVYEVLNQSGPAHHRHFRIAVLVNDEQIGVGEGSSKKQAQQNAAFDALEKLGK